MPRRPYDNRLKALIAQECARMLIEEGVQDFSIARRKAALRLGITDRAALPDHQEIELALADRQRLFHADRQADQLRKLRETALGAMRLLAQFRPRLTGPVLSGAIGPNTSVQLHLFADAPEEVAVFLMDQQIPFETGVQRLKMANGDQIYPPVFRVHTGLSRMDLTVFRPLAEREAPLSPLTGRPMHRASATEIQILLAGASP